MNTDTPPPPDDSQDSKAQDSEQSERDLPLMPGLDIPESGQEENESPPPLAVPPPLKPATTVSPSPPLIDSSISTATSSVYRVLARKYRPRNFSELIGQEAMVQTLANAIKRNRLAHAFLMTGVRGVGKTSTARLIARALNCIGTDGSGGPTIDPCSQCEPCLAIAEGSYIDVIEMDAASHTGVDDVREIIEAVRYAAVAARYKIYIIDEVHMLSKNAFNALLKTLEEPPPHVKFLFATTEVNKIPVTVLSRCQRFDLRRIPPDLLYEHFTMIAEKEEVNADIEAVRLIANAAEGSVRDGLSLLDQAIAHADLDGGGRVEAKQVRVMLGLSDRATVARLFAAVLEGETPVAIDLARAQYALGAEPEALVRGLMELVHAITLAKVARYDDPQRDSETRHRIEGWGNALGFAALNRLWQLLHKGYGEIRTAATPFEHLEMLLLRIIYAAQLPDPSELARMIEQMQKQSPPADTAPPTAGNATVEKHSASAVETHRSSGESIPESVMTISNGAISNDNNAPTASPIEHASRASPTPYLAEEARPYAPDTPEVRYPQPSESNISLPWLCQQLESAGAHRLAVIVHDHLRPIDMATGRVVFAPVPQLDSATIAEVSQNLRQATGRAWSLIAASDSKAQATPSLREVETAAAQAERDRMLAHPLVKAAFAAFPQARLRDSSAIVPSNAGASGHKDSPSNKATNQANPLSEKPPRRANR